MVNTIAPSPQTVTDPLIVLFDVAALQDRLEWVTLIEKHSFAGSHVRMVKGELSDSLCLFRKFLLVRS